VTGEEQLPVADQDRSHERGGATDSIMEQEGAVTGEEQLPVTDQDWSCDTSLAFSAILYSNTELCKAQKYDIHCLPLMFVSFRSQREVTMPQVFASHWLKDLRIRNLTAGCK